MPEMMRILAIRGLMSVERVAFSPPRIAAGF
jgi:hypothetical protein